MQRFEGTLHSPRPLANDLLLAQALAPRAIRSGPQSFARLNLRR